jgi:hypothetical protein
MKKEKLSMRDVCYLYGRDIKDARERFIDGICNAIVENTRDGMLPLDFYTKGGDHPHLQYKTLSLIEDNEACIFHLKYIDAKKRRIYFKNEAPDGYTSSLRTSPLDLFPADELYCISEFILGYIEEDFTKFFESIMSEEDARKIENSFIRKL